MPKCVTLNCADFFIMQFKNKREYIQKSINNSLDINSKDFINIYKNVLQSHVLF